MGIQAKETTNLKLKGRRTEFNYTQSEIADILKISKATYARKENGKCQFDVNEIHQLMDILDASFDELFQNHIRENQ